MLVVGKPSYVSPQDQHKNFAVTECADPVHSCREQLFCTRPIPFHPISNKTSTDVNFALGLKRNDTSYTTYYVFLRDE
jgi:hypothetical protein